MKVTDLIDTSVISHLFKIASDFNHNPILSLSLRQIQLKMAEILMNFFLKSKIGAKTIT